MGKLINNDFNKSTPLIVHIDINSCFATCEQQANPFYRNKPLAVTSYDSKNAVILAASIEAKRMGIKTCMRVSDAKLICNNIIIVPSDPDKYRFVHEELKKILLCFTPDIVPKSIDEFVCNFSTVTDNSEALLDICRQIKHQIHTNIGEWVNVSIGISNNTFLAKVASNLKKPDGLEEININNYLSVYGKLQLRDLHGVGSKVANLLNCHGVYTVLEFYNSDLNKLKSIFKSVHAFYWFIQLRGWEVSSSKNTRASFSNIHTLKEKTNNSDKIKTVLFKLIINTMNRSRKQNFSCRGVGFSFLYIDHTSFQKRVTLDKDTCSDQEIFLIISKIIDSLDIKIVTTISFFCFNLSLQNGTQLGLLENIAKKKDLVDAMDNINDKFGNFSITPARVLSITNIGSDSIGFGKIK